MVRPPTGAATSSPRNILPIATEPNIDAHLSVNPADEIKTTTCYMCACRCGIACT